MKRRVLGFRHYQQAMNEKMEHQLYKEKYGVCDPFNNIEIVGDNINESYKNLLRESVRNLVITENQKLFEKKKIDLCKISDLCRGNLGVPRILMPVIEDNQLGEFMRLLKAGKLTTDAKKLKDYGYDVNAKGHRPSNHPIITSGEFLNSGDGRSDVVKAKANQSISIQKLNATQNQIEKTHTEGMVDSAENPQIKWNPWNAPILVSNDNYVLDGHHRWAASLMYHLKYKDTPGYKQVKMNGTVIDLDVRTLLAVANAYTDTIGNKRKQF